MAERTLNCPACGAPLNIGSRFTQLVVCQFCGQTSWVRDDGLDPTGQTAKLTDYASRLRVGVRGSIGGRPFSTLGRVRYRYEDGTWDEWFLRFDDGQPAWLSEDEGEYVLYNKRRLTSPVPPWEEIRVGTAFDVPPHRVFVTEKGSGGILGAEGELAITAPPGAVIRYIDGNASGKIVGLVFTESGINFSVGEPYDFQAIVVNAGTDAT